MSLTKKRKIPSHVFTQCPNCTSKHLIHVLEDCVCGECDWLSVKAHVDSGGMDAGPFSVSAERRGAANG